MQCDLHWGVVLQCYVHWGVVDETVVVITFAGDVTVVWMLVESVGGAVLLNVEPVNNLITVSRDTSSQKQTFSKVIPALVLFHYNKKVPQKFYVRLTRV